MKGMAIPLGFALLGWFFRLLFAFYQVEAATCKYNKYTTESEAGLDRECSGGSAWGHRSGEEVLLTVIAVTIILPVFYWWFFKQVAIPSEGHDETRFEVQGNSSNTIIPIREETSIMEDPYVNYRNGDTYQWNQMVNEQGAYASKPLLSLVNDHSELVENIFEHLDTRIEGAGHYEVIAKYFGYNVFKIKSRFEKCDGGPSRAMIEAIATHQPEITVESFAVVVEEQARRSDVADLLRAYDSDVLNKSV